MSIIWIVGGLYFWSHYERKPAFRPDLSKSSPPIAILVPCHNESATIALTCETLSSLAYVPYHVIFVDDASSDQTSAVIRTYVSKTPQFHLICLEENLGKAGALNTALSLVDTPYVLILDADTLISGNTLRWLVLPFISQPNLGAVTANPIPYNRKGFLSSLQTAEFMSIIGLIKRCQIMSGQIFTVSGCATLYKTKVLQQVGGFSTGTATEDIDATWRIQRASYRIWFQPQALALIQVPIKLSEYWRQRKRWATGGWHFLRVHKNIFRHWHLRKLWLLYLDFTLAYTWAFCFFLLLLLWLLSLTISFSISFSPVPFIHGAMISLLCLVQMAIAVEINAPYDPGIKKTYFWMPWYPLFFFLIGALLVVWTAPKSLLGSLQNSGKWKSPKRVSEHNSS